MDMWSDPNLSPFMAVTAHWIETIPVQTPQGLQHTLKLRADLIGFQRVPGHHTSEHLAFAFMHVLERLEILPKVRTHTSHHDNSILTRIPLLDWMGHIRQCFQQRYIYGQARI